MIFFQILVFIISIFLLSLSLSGYGTLVNLNIKRNFFLNIFLGFILVSFLIVIIHFFLRISYPISFLIFILGIIIFFYKKEFNLSKLIRIKNLSSLVIFVALIPIFLSQKYHEDFGYYHLPYALGLVEDKIIFGFANIDQSYVYNSIWLNLYSIFFLGEKNFDFLTLPSYLLFLIFILFCFHKITSNDKKFISDYFLLVALFYFILKFTRISEFGVDLPASIFSTLTIYHFLKFSEVDLIREKKEYFFLILIFSIFSILIKLSTIPVVLLPLFLYFKHFNYLKFDIFKFKFFLIYIFLISFLIQQFIYTGCLFFPSNLTCFNVSWFSKDILNLSYQLELINKSYFSVAKDFLSPDEYLKDFNWLSYWFKRNLVEILEHLLTMILPVLLFLFFQKKKNDDKFIFSEKLGLYLFLLLGFLFWLNFSPVYRFAIYLFLTLIFALFVRNLSSKVFSKKIFTIFIMSFVFFSFSKNIIRLTKVENIFLGVIKIDNQYKLSDKNISELVKVYEPDIKKNLSNGWQGGLCWNIPFICSYNKLELRKKNGYLIINKLID